MSFCRNCGKEIPDQFRFCLSCGTPINAFSAPAIPVLSTFENSLLRLSTGNWLLWALLCPVIAYAFNFALTILLSQILLKNVRTVQSTLEFGKMLTYGNYTFFTLLMSCGLTFALGRWRDVGLAVTAISSLVVALVFAAVVNGLPPHSFWIDLFGRSRLDIDSLLAGYWTLSRLAGFLLIGAAIGFSVSLPSKNAPTIMKICLAGLLAGLLQSISYLAIGTVILSIAKLLVSNLIPITFGTIVAMAGFPANVLGGFVFCVSLVLISKALIGSAGSNG